MWSMTREVGSAFCTLVLREDEASGADPPAWTQHRVRSLPLSFHLHRVPHLFSVSDTIPEAGEHPHGGAAP
jgi:hypothetical protein